MKCTGVENGNTVSILVRGSNKLIVDEAERSLHDALCVVRAIVKSKGLVCGGGFKLLFYIIYKEHQKLKWLIN